MVSVPSQLPRECHISHPSQATALPRQQWLQCSIRQGIQPRTQHNTWAFHYGQHGAILVLADHFPCSPSHPTSYHYTPPVKVAVAFGSVQLLLQSPVDGTKVHREGWMQWSPSVICTRKGGNIFFVWPCPADPMQKREMIELPLAFLVGLGVACPKSSKNGGA